MTDPKDLPIEEQLALLLQGVADEIPEGGLKSALERARKEDRPLRVKFGADPNVPHLHLGHTVPLRKLRTFQNLGHDVYFLIGDFTAMIGDPTNRSAARAPLSRKQIEENVKTYEEQVYKVLDRRRTKVVYNSEWCRKLKFEDVIRIASKYTVARLLERDDFSERYKSGQPLGLHEFLYPLVQGYDSVELKADVEMCGTDQIFNCHVARALQESAGQPPETIVAVPLIEGTDGVQKMSKSLGNAIGITEAPQEMYGKLLSIPDQLIAKYAELLIDAPLDPALSPRDAKHALARTIVAMYHGTSEAGAAAEHFERIFVRGETPENLSEIALPADAFKQGRIWAVRLLTESKLVGSKAEAQRLVKQGAVELDGKRIDDPGADLAPADGAVLRVGKRKFIRLRVSKD